MLPSDLRNKSVLFRWEGETKWVREALRADGVWGVSVGDGRWVRMTTGKRNRRCWGWRRGI